MQSMTDYTVDKLANQLAGTTVCPAGVSFQGKSLKLNTENDCAEVVNAIKECKHLEFLNLEGNTLGVDASKAISKALETKSELKKALWKDMFTGRMKEEIPKALEYLGNGLTIAKAQLTELDLSDNAFGPIGVSGLANLLSSPSCYQLQELKLNNNGLGISGSKMLAKALLQCHENSSKEGKAFALKTLIIGRNRLENEGATALANVLKTLGSLEEISMPQNGIYHKGMKALSHAFKKNPNLKLLNLNDNTITKKGAIHIAEALPYLEKLKILNLGDCLLRTGGAKVLAEALGSKHADLEELHLSFNEIKLEGGLAIAKAMANKTHLKALILNGNQFGSDGRTLVKEALAMNKRISALGSLSEDESVDENESDENEQSNDEEEEGDEDEIENEHQNVFSFISAESGSPRGNVPEKTERDNLTDFLENLSIKETPVGTLKTFLENPSIDTLLEVKENQITDFINANQDHSVDFYVETFIPLLVKVSSFSCSYNEQVKALSCKLSKTLFTDLFKWANEKNRVSTVNNVLFVYLGLIKSEDKCFKINWDVKGSVSALKAAISDNVVPKETHFTLNLLLESQKNKDEHCEADRRVINVEDKETTQEIRGS